MQISRLFEIIYILMNKNTVTAKELSERFEVSQRTIYRDVDKLALAGIPVYTCKGKGGGIRLMEDFVLNKSLLTDKEQSDILAALEGLSAINADSSEAHGRLSSLFNKEAVNWIDVDFSKWSNPGDNLFSLLKQSILEKKIIEFDYYNSYGECSHRRIEPIQLFFKHSAWYIKGFCLKKNDIRLFKLSRISNPAADTGHFEKRDLFASIPNENTADIVDRDVSIKLRIAPQMAYRVYDEFEHNQIEKESDGCYTALVTWPEDEWVYGFILSFGEYIEVLEPEFIRQGVCERALKITHKYL